MHHRAHAAAVAAADFSFALLFKSLYISAAVAFVDRDLAQAGMRGHTSPRRGSAGFGFLVSSLLSLFLWVS